ncbi:MAG: AsmA family protein [Pseudomonadota bacterium]
MSRTKKIVLWSGLGLLSLLALCVILFLTFDWNRAKPWINSRVSEATGRPFSINGDLSLTWHRGQEELSGWRGKIPWPLLSAQNVTLGNPEWATAAPNLAEVDHLSFSVNPLQLLNHKIVIPTLVLGRPNVTLQRAADNKNNWTLKSGDPSKWKLELGRLQLNEGKVRLVDAIKRADLKADIASLKDQDSSGFRLGWKLGGTFNGERVTGSGKSGGILALQATKDPFPVEADLRIGKTSIIIDGTATNPKSLASINTRLKLSGPSMADLYPITGVLLPETPPYATEGSLTGVFNKDGGDWTYEKFKGKVGSSDLAGSLKYESKKPRPLLSGELVSNLLRLEDLGPVIGADSNKDKTKRGAPTVAVTDKVLPKQDFDTKKWQTIDADVKFTGRKVIAKKDLPIDSLVTEIHLKDGVLSLTPLNFGIAGGNMVSTVKLDGRGKIIKAQMKISARRLKLKELFPPFDLMKASIGEVNGDASLSATGNSVGAMLASSNGEIKALINQGTVSKLLLEQIGLNVGSIILTSLFGDKQVNINCMASDFSVTNGLMDTRTFVVDTDEAVLLVAGQIDLAKEQLNLKINPRSRSFHLVSLRSPIYVTGKFKTPKVALDKGAIAMKAGSALALGFLAPLAALIPLMNAGGAEDSGCTKLLAEAKIKPIAPPPGKTYQEKSTSK